VKLCKCGALFSLVLAVGLALLLNGTLRDLGLTKRLDHLVVHGDERFFGSFPFLYSEPWGFDFSKIPELSGQVAVVTGANTGLGYFTALHLARNGAEVIMGCRSVTKCNAAAATVTTNLTNAPVSGGKAVPLLIDLSSLKSVHDFVGSLQQLLGSRGLDQLVLNAGFVAPDFSLTSDGIESQWQVNHVGHMYLYTLAKEMLANAVTAHGKATVTAVSSAAHYGASSVPFKLDEINHVGGYSATRRYSQTKLANVLFAMEAQRLCTDENIYINALHPGVVNTEFVRPDSINAFLGDTLGPILLDIAKPLIAAIGWDSEIAALTQLYVSASPEISARGIKGAYFHPLAQLHTTSALATEENAKKLWTATKEIISAKTSNIQT